MNIITGNKNYLFLRFKIKQVLRIIRKKVILTAFGKANNQINKIFIINLDRQTERWELIKKELKNIPTNVNINLSNFSERFSAIDAKIKLLNNTKINSTYKLQDQYFVDPDPRLLKIIREKEINIELTNQETAVALSHISVWEKIILKDVSNALILEDDVYFENKFSKTLNLLWEEIESSSLDFDIIFLSYKKVEHNPDIKKVSKNLSVPKRGIWWFSGYILSNNGAKKLLSKLPVIGPIDLWINHEFANLNVYLSNESIINQKLFVQSDNNYSILPILSQIGIKSNETFILLDKLKGKNPVFVFDLSENCDTTLSKINTLLSLNSYRAYKNVSERDSLHVKESIKQKQTLLFDAYLGFNLIIDNLSDLINFYPSGIIIIIEEVHDKSLQSVLSNEISTNLHFINSNSKKVFKQVSKLLQIKYWEFNDIKLNQVKIDKNINSEKIQIINKFKYLEHDVNPWIIPIQNIEKYIPYNHTEFEILSLAKPIDGISDSFNKMDLNYWKLLDDTFPSNLAHFTKRNFRLNNSGFEITITNDKLEGKQYSSSAIVTKLPHIYGSFEISMKPIKGDGIISAFFLHRNDPWQEIDIEFLGNDTTKILLNVYYNPGFENTNYNYGVRGTPILIDLDFDASEDFHLYRIEWEYHEIRWYVDNKIIHSRRTWMPTPIPDLPLNVYVNAWITNSEALAGKFNNILLPAILHVKLIEFYKFEY
ncbi:family 16 glycosylhydrolase [Flavobacterium sp. CAN_S2]|uniref:family 16 glycosylhydrolase n=1 Tax=Flavobacterium sp. CAN_S2 TaxID=2787726 RepID=UPI0018CB9A7E